MPLPFSGAALMGKKPPTAVIIVHNHPTGHLRPSKADIDMTRHTKDALNTVDIILHDHIIVGGAKTVSFKSMGSL